MEHRQLTGYLIENGKFKDDMFVNVTIVNVPASTLRVCSEGNEFVLSWRNKRSTSGLDEKSSSGGEHEES